MPAEIHSVLIVRLSAIGDVIHALPVLDALRREKPQLKIGWVVEELSAPLLENHPQIDKLYVIPKKRWKKYWHALLLSEIRPFFRQMRAEGWDATVDLQGLTKSGYVAKASGAGWRVGFGDHDGRELNKIFNNRKITPPEWSHHVVERNLSLLEGLGIKPSKDAVGRIGITADEKETMRASLEKAGWSGSERLLAINPGAGWASKRWEPRRFAETAATLSKRKEMRPLILWGPGEEAARDEIKEELGKQKVPCIIAPATSVREMAVLISLCTLFIGGDTGPTHIAGLLGIPNVAIFGASDARRNRPWPLTSGTVVQDTDLFCVPCWDTVCRQKGNANMACLRGIAVGRVVEAALEVLAKGRTSSGLIAQPAS